MTNVSLENIKGNAIGGIVAALIMAAVPTGKLAEFTGQSAAALLLVVGAAAVWLLVVVYHRYVQILGAGGSRKETAGRQAYDRLRASLEGGGPVGQLYSDRLKKFLDATDAFFGDTASTRRNLLHQLFQLETPAATWTAHSFDRCLLLAMAYPIVTVFLVWAVTGHVGPAESSLLLNEDVAWWRRVFTTLALVCAIVAGLATRGDDWTRAQTALLLVGLCLSIAFALAGAGSFGGYFFDSPALAGIAVVLGLAIVTSYTVSDQLTGTTVLCAALLIAIAAGYSGALSNILRFWQPLGFAFGLSLITQSKFWRKRLGLVIIPFVIAMTAICLIEAYQVASYPRHSRHGEALLMFLVFFTLINAPFDWFSLGLTRALLRRGLELRGWWPFLLAIADAIAATIVVTLLALTMVIGVQAFDRLIVHGGGTPTLPFEALMTGLREQPTDPKYWWIYSLLLSTMIPSLINLAIGGSSLMRGVPGISQWLLSRIPDKRSVPKLDRSLVGLVLTFQVGVGILLGGLAQAFLVWFLFFYAMPLVGTSLLDIAAQMAAFDLPLWVEKLFVGN